MRGMKKQGIPRATLPYIAVSWKCPVVGVVIDKASLSSRT